MTSTKINNFEKFSEWYNGFIEKNDGTHHPPSLEDWYDSCVKNHEKINNIIEGTQFELEFKFNDVKAPAETVNAKRLVSDILYYIPAYLDTYDLRKEDLLSSTINDNMKTAKHISTYLSRQYNGDDYKIDRVKALLSKLGEEWANAEISSCELVSILSTNPKAFISLGHYGPDNKSCFKQTGSNESHKYHLGESVRNSFVLIIKNKAKNNKITLNSRGNLARMWGFYDEKTETVNFCNLYGTKLSLSIIKEICKSISAKILNISEDDITDTEKMLKASLINIYFNCGKNGNYTFHAKNNKPINLITIG